MSAENVIPLKEENSSNDSAFDGEDDRHDELELGTTLMYGQYTITGFLNRGGFGITYLANDSLSRSVVIKECFPSELCYRVDKRVAARSRTLQGQLSAVVRGFVHEAKNLAALEHKNIVGVHQIFEDNSTAYMAIDFIDGMDMLDIIEDDAAHLTPTQIVNITNKLLGAISFVHSNGILHRDISPDNILINTDGEPILIDFGAAKEEATNKERNLSNLRVVKDGYSPQEFYVPGAEQGAWSDLYSFGASLYHVIDGKLPPNCQTRLSSLVNDNMDPYVPLAGRIQGYPVGFLEAIDKSMQALPRHRIQTADEWLAMLANEGTHEDKILRRTVSNLTNRRKSNEFDDFGNADDLVKPKTKSKTPMLVGAALMAVLVGAGVFFGTRPGDPVVEPVVVAEAEAPAEAIVIAEDEAVAETILDAGFVAAFESPVIAGAPEVEGPVTAEISSFGDTNSFQALPGSIAAPNAPTAIALNSTTPPEAIGPAEQITSNGLSFAVWNVAMPFDVSLEQVRNANVATITELHLRNLSASDTWITPGAEIHLVNETRLDDGVQLETYILNGMNLDPDGKTRASVMYKDANSKKFERALLTVPVVRDIWMSDGTRFHQRMEGNSWISEVIATGSMPGSELEVGDVLTRETFTGIELTEPEAMEQILDRAAESELESVSFTVTRNGRAITANLPLQRGSE